MLCFDRRPTGTHDHKDPAHIPLLTALWCGVCCVTATQTAGVAQARYGVHPSVGPVAPPDPSYLQAISRRFNVPDGQWNLGEGFFRTTRNGITPPPNAPADTGGYLFFDDGRDVTLDDVHVQGGGWTTWTYTDPISGAVTDMQRLRGFLAPHEFAAPADAFAAETAFEILVPATMHGDDTVIVLATFPTMSAAAGQNITEYPGHPASAFVDPANAGFQGNLTDAATGRYATIYRPGELDRIVSFSGTAHANGINVITAFIMPSISGGHMTMTAQRMLQFERALQLILDPSSCGSFGPPTPVTSSRHPIPVVAMGGSNGGHVVQFLATHFPDRVHAAYSDQFSATMRHTAGFQEVALYMTALQGFSFSTEVHGVAYNLPYTAPYAMVGFKDTWTTGTTLPLWSAGLVIRPLFLHGSDEDTVWIGGHEVIPLLADQPWSPVGATPRRHNRPAPLFWSFIDKGTHQPRGVFELPDPLLAAADGSSGAESHPLHANNGPLTEPELAVLPFADEVIASYDRHPPHLGQRPTEQQVKQALYPLAWNRYDPDAPTDPRLDPFDHALARPSTHERAQPRFFPPRTLLSEDTTFRARETVIGAGLGVGEALTVDPDGGVWVGSADGVVTRLVRNGTTDPTRSPDALLVDKRCRFSADDDPLEGPFSLGYGVYGLEVAHGYLAIATHRRLYVYDLQGNQELAPCDFMCDLSWHEQRPSHMRIVEDMFGSGGVQIAYLGYLGELVVREIAPGLPARAWLSEPGASDFEIGSGHPTPGFSKPVYVATRGHVVQVVMSCDNLGTFPTAVQVRASSERIGNVGDMIVGEHMNGPALTVILGRNNMPSNGIAQLDLDDLATIEMWNLPPEAPIFGSPTIEGWPRRIARLAEHEFVVLGHGELYYAPNPNDVTMYELRPGNHANVVNLPSIYFAVGLAVGDVGADGEADVVVATESGQVVYIPRNLFTSGQVALMGQLVLGDEWFFNGIPPTPERWSTGSASATWGMTFGPSRTEPGEDWIQLVDQCGRRWEVDPFTQVGAPDHGVPVFRNMVRDSLLGIFPVPATKPFRDLLYVGRNPPSTVVFPDFARDIGPSWTPGAYFQQGSRVHMSVAIPPSPPFLPFTPAVPPDASLTGPPLVTYDAREHYQLWENGYLPIAWGGDVMTTFPGDPARTEAYFWQGTTELLAPDLQGANGVRGARFPGVTGGGVDEFFTTSTKLGAITPAQAHFRNPTALSTPHGAQSLRLGMWDGELKAVLGTAGGGIMVLDPSAALNSPEQLAERPAASGDHGFGGMALCVDKVRENTNACPSIFFGTVYGHARKRLIGYGGRDIVSTLHSYTFEAGPEAEPVEVDRVVLDGLTPNRPRVFGVCGIAVADVLEEPWHSGVRNELIVTSLDGDLLVFDLQAGSCRSGARIGRLLHHSVHDGALGANNAILVDEQASPKAIYVSGSSGLRRFEVTGDNSCGWPF